MNNHPSCTILMLLCRKKNQHILWNVLVYMSKQYNLLLIKCIKKGICQSLEDLKFSSGLDLLSPCFPLTAGMVIVTWEALWGYSGYLYKLTSLVMHKTYDFSYLGQILNGLRNISIKPYCKLNAFVSINMSYYKIQQ